MVPNPFKWDLIIRYAKKTFIPQVPDRKLLLSTHLRSSQKLLLSRKFRLIIFLKNRNFLPTYKPSYKVLSHDLSTKKWNIVVCDICHTFDHTYCKGCQPKLRQYFVTRIFHQKIKKKL